MKEFYIAIAEVYQTVSLASPKVEGNPCGACRTCCTSAAASHKVSDLELATMEWHLGAERVAPFRRYLQREKAVDGTALMENCPMLGPDGCTVHEYRPMSCRLYGHFRAESTPLFEHCVFQGQETVFADHQEHLLTPGQPELTELNLDYLSYFPPTFGAGSIREKPYLEAQTPMEKASELKCLGEFAAARDLLLELRVERDTPNLLLMLAECHEALADYSDAIEVLEAAMKLSPMNPELYTRLGANHLWLGQLEPSAKALQHSLKLASDRRNAQGLMGTVCQLQADLTSARLHLARAVELEDEPGPYRFSLASVLRDLKETQAAREMFLAAQEYSPTRQAAQQALESL